MRRRSEIHIDWMIEKEKNLPTLQEGEKTGDQVDLTMKQSLMLKQPKLQEFLIFYETVKGHQSIEPESVENSSACILSGAISELTHETVRQRLATEENLLDTETPLSTTCSQQSRNSSTLNGSCVNQAELEDHPTTKKELKTKTHS